MMKSSDLISFCSVKISLKTIIYHKSVVEFFLHDGLTFSCYIGIKRYSLIFTFFSGVYLWLCSWWSQLITWCSWLMKVNELSVHWILLKVELLHMVRKKDSQLIIERIYNPFDKVCEWNILYKSANAAT